jgi:hypothetical protein
MVVDGDRGRLNPVRKLYTFGSICFLIPTECGNEEKLKTINKAKDKMAK